MRFTLALGQQVALPNCQQKMTVSSVAEGGSKVTCIWFNQELGGEPVECTFDRALLVAKSPQPTRRPHQPQEPVFSVRDNVTLCSSDKPVMTVAEILEDGIQCIWFDPHHREPMRFKFPAATLSLFDEPS